MWQCECGEFNNDRTQFCLKCGQIKILDIDTVEKNLDAESEYHTQAMFRRIQDFLLFDIAFTALIALYCFWRKFDVALPIIVLILTQILLVVNILRMFYKSALNSERNSIFLQRIYEIVSERQRKEQDEKDEKLR